jgi:hypothetical protein
MATGAQAMQQARELPSAPVPMETCLHGAMDGIEAAVIRAQLAIPVVDLHVSGRADRGSAHKPRAPAGSLRSPFDEPERWQPLQQVLSPPAPPDLSM